MPAMLQPERVRLGFRYRGAAELTVLLARRHGGLAGGTARPRRVLGQSVAAIHPPVARVDRMHALGQLLDRDAGALREQLPHRLGDEQEPRDPVVQPGVAGAARVPDALGIRGRAPLARLQVLDLYLLDDVPEIHASSRGPRAGYRRGARVAPARAPAAAGAGR